MDDAIYSTNNLIDACRQLENIEPDKELKNLSSKFLRFIETTGEQVIPSDAIESLNTLPPFGASWIAILFGNAVESGSDPNLTGSSLINLLSRWISDLPEVPDDAENDNIPQLTETQRTLVECMPYLSQSVVAHLARMPDYRLQLYCDNQLYYKLENAEAYTHSATWVKETLNRKSGNLIVIHVKTKKAFLLNYKNVSNCFHLFSLIQLALANKFKKSHVVSDMLKSAILGESTSDGKGDSALWHFGSPHSPTPDLTHSIWGEGHVSEIPSIDGYQVILLWPMIMKSRSWSGGFFSPRIDAMKPNIEIERELDHNEVLLWFEKLGVDKYFDSTQIKTPWWKFW